MGSPGGPLGSGFRALFFGSLISNTGDGIRLAALPLLATQLTSSPVLVSAVTGGAGTRPSGTDDNRETLGNGFPFGQ